MATPKELAHRFRGNESIGTKRMAWEESSLPPSLHQTGATRDVAHDQLDSLWGGVREKPSRSR